MTAVYNENEPAAANVLREMIANGHIAPGDVDERSIKDVSADDYRGYDQWHFFAGMGAWSGALRRAGWADKRHVITGSCPCQPFSGAGKGLGFDDPRHLWPDWLRIIDEARQQGFPGADTIFGEQVDKANLWVDLVQSDLEARGFAFGSPDLPAAGFAQGAHIRQRFYWVADRNNAERWADLAGRDIRDWPQTGWVEGDGQSGAGIAVGGMADVSLQRQRQEPANLGGVASGDRPQGRSAGPDSGGADVWLGDDDDAGRQGWRLDQVGGGDQCAVRATGLAGDVDWLLCRDGKIRPVESGTFPLAASRPGRLGSLRVYGNGLDLETAVNFVSAYMEALEISDTMALYA